MHSKPIPSEEQIIRLLEEFDPKPSQRFYQRIEKQPWMATRKSTFKFSLWGITWRVAAVAIAVVLVFCFTPSQQFLFGSTHTPTATSTSTTTPTPTAMSDEKRPPSPTPQPETQGQYIMPKSTATTVGRW